MCNCHGSVRRHIKNCGFSDYFFSFFLLLLAWWHAIITPAIITQASANFEFWRKKTETKQKIKTNLSAVFWLNEECPTLLSSLVIDHRRRKTIPLWNSSGGGGGEWILQGITVCLVSTILGTVWYPGRFQTVSRDQVLVFFYGHSSRMYLMKEKQGGPIPTGLKRWPLKLVKRLTDTTGIRHLLQVQGAAVLWTFYTWSFE